VLIAEDLLLLTDDDTRRLLVAGAPLDMGLGGAVRQAIDGMMAAVTVAVAAGGVAAGSS
jgi:hypothetical protein